MKRILGILLFAVATLTVMAQKTVTGVVSDRNSEPLIGATVKAVGSNEATVTDVDGNFSLKISESVRQIEVSYVGYRTLITNIKGGKMDIRLDDDTKLLNEVVAIGYGSVKRGDITNAVAKINADELQDRPVSNIASALQGELAGVEVQSISGQPGSTVTIKVRGATAINEDASIAPLYVVDGVPMDDDFDFNTLNPQEIESIEVLKDASSSAIYGSRGANGVILITSKKGTNDGKTKVTINASFAISAPERYMPVMSGQDWINWRSMVNTQNYLNAYGNKGAQAGDTYGERVAILGGKATITSVGDPLWSMPGYGGLNIVDWQKAMFRTSTLQNYNISVTNGTEKSNWRASVGYVDQEGIVIGTSFKRLTAKFSGQTKIGNNLTIGFDLAPQMSIMEGGNVDGKDNAASKALSLVPVTENAAGLYTGAEPYTRYLYAGNGASPVAIMEQKSMREEQIRLFTSAFARYELLKGLTAEVLGSWIFSNRDRKNYLPSSADYRWNSSTEGYYTTATWTGSRSHKYLLQATATYDHTWHDVHHLNVVGGWSMESSQDNSSYQMSATQFPNNSVPSWTINDVQVNAFTATVGTPDHLVSYFARAEYGYDSRYLVNASIRRDGSSRFGKNRKWGTFPAVSAAWRINNEKFWKDSWAMNQAKLRISYGSNGYNSIPLNAASGMMGTSYYSQDGKVVTGYTPSSQNNDDLGWQKTNSWNFGLDMGFFRNRISFAVDYYVKTISDMLYQQTVPAASGQTTAWRNIGNVRTKGLEMELKTENLSGKLKWTTKLAVGYSTNEVTDLGSNSAIYTGYDNATQIIEVGHPVGEYYLYIAEGIYETADDLKRYAKETTSEVGSVRYKDVNKDGVIDENDRTYCGKASPDWTFGITNTFRWKNWDASILFTAQCGGKIWSALGRAIDMQNQGISINRLERWQNQWLSEEHTGDGMTPLSYGGSSQEQFSTRWLYSTDFLKLKNITIGYKLKFKKKAFVNSLRLTASMENLFMIDKYDNGYSPESNNSGSSLKAYDYGAYPHARTFSLGANVQF